MDAVVAPPAAWLALAVPLACSAVMLVDLGVGGLAPTSVLAVTLVDARSYVLAGRGSTPPDDPDLKRPAGR